MTDQATANGALPTALVVIDVQGSMIAPDSSDEPAPYRADEVLANIGSLIDQARVAGAKVVFIRHREDDYPPMAPGHPGFEVHPSIAPLAGEAVLDKTACDSFCDTELEAILRGAGVGHIVTCGMQTDACVDTASRSAMHRGFNVTLASDAHTTWDNGVLTAEQIIAHHNRTLAGIPGPGTRIEAKPSAEIEFAKALAQHPA